ncbi:MAG: IS1595 family transposase [Phycisphaera sp.]|nr:IS1595 family transposase [Phycisphaera sp.]
MARNQKKVGQDKSEIVADIPLACADETAAVEFLEKQRWDGGACCPRCGDVDVYQMRDRKTGERNKRFLWRCKGCKQQFTVRIGTVMEESRIPARHWVYAFWRMCTSKKGVSALEIKRHTGLSYKSALFLLHRVRWAAAPKQDGPKLKGTVEVDETRVGGKPRKHRPHRADGKYTWKHKPKAPVFGAVVRETGQVRARVIPSVTTANLKKACNELIDQSSTLISDEAPAYVGIGREYAGHESVKHSAYEYVRGDITTNTIESFWAILKRGINGVYHNVSRKHLQRYVDEFEFRYNHREMEDGERVVAAIRGANDKRLMYREPVAG